jgi:hypothetical protein
MGAEEGIACWSPIGCGKQGLRSKTGIIGRFETY